LRDHAHAAELQWTARSSLLPSAISPRGSCSDFNDSPILLPANIHCRHHPLPCAKSSEVAEDTIFSIQVEPPQGASIVRRIHIPLFFRAVQRWPHRQAQVRLILTRSGGFRILCGSLLRLPRPSVGYTFKSGRLEGVNSVNCAPAHAFSPIPRKMRKNLWGTLQQAARTGCGPIFRVQLTRTMDSYR
jgi:hypothetical protein